MHLITYITYFSFGMGSPSLQCTQIAKKNQQVLKSILTYTKHCAERKSKQSFFQFVTAG